MLPLICILFSLKRIKLNFFIIAFSAYLLLFFLLNNYYTEIKTTIGKTGYYFIYTLIEYLTFTYILWNSITDKKFKKSIIFLSCLFILFLTIFYSLVKIKRLDSVPIGVETILLIIYILYFFFRYFKSINDDYIYNNASFWFVTGILIYLGITFFFNILANSLDRDLFKMYYYYSYLGDILKNLLFTVAIIFLAHNNKKNISQKLFNAPYLDMI